MVPRNSWRVLCRHYEYYCCRGTSIEMPFKTAVPF